MPLNAPPMQRTGWPIILRWPLLLLLSHFSRVWLCATPQTAAYQAPPSLGFSRQEHWSGLPFPSPMHESEKWKWSRSSCPTPSNPMDCSLPGSSIHGIFQARVLEWGAIAFSSETQEGTEFTGRTRDVKISGLKWYPVSQVQSRALFYVKEIKT